MRYQIDKFNPDGTRVGVIEAFNSLSYVRTENQVGALQIVMPLKGWKYEDWQVGQILEVWREKGGVNTLQNETAYFVQDWELYNEGGQHMIAVYAKDANCLLAGRIVYAASGSTNAEMTDYADDMMKVVVTNELGTGAATTRQIPRFTVQGEVGKSVSMTRGFAYGNLLGVCQDIANSATEQGTYTCFDMVRTGVATFQFRTYVGQRGTDHRRSSGDVRLVGEKYGNLEDARLGRYHGEEWNFVYCGGQGEGTARVIQTASDATRIGAGYPYNRKEYWRDARHQDTAAGVSADAYAALNEGKPKLVMTGKLLDTPGMQFGRDYQFGDVVSVEAFDMAIDCHVASVGVDYSAENGEQIDIRLRGEV